MLSSLRPCHHPPTLFISFLCPSRSSILPSFAPNFLPLFLLVLLFYPFLFSFIFHSLFSIPLAHCLFFFPSITPHPHRSLFYRRFSSPSVAPLSVLLLPSLFLFSSLFSSLFSFLLLRPICDPYQSLSVCRLF